MARLSRFQPRLILHDVNASTDIGQLTWLLEPSIQYRSDANDHQKSAYSIAGFIG